MRERTLALIKPDAVRRGLVGTIIRALELSRDLDPPNGLRILAMEMRRMSVEQAEAFYGRQHRGKSYFIDLVAFTSSGPLVVLILEGENAIARWRFLMGAADPTKRLRDTIRGQFAEGFPIMENLVHGSDSPESFLHEAGVFRIETL